MPDTLPEMTEYAEAAGLKARDMPSAHHPIMENDEDIRTLSDLIDARDDRTHNDIDDQKLVNDNTLDLEEALTFPHKKHEQTSAERTPALTDFDGDAMTKSPADNEEDIEYMGRPDFMGSMNDPDPDPNAGSNPGDTTGEGEGRAADITGTVTGIARGMATHLPQDIGADGFQIEGPEMSGDPRASGAGDVSDASTDPDDPGASDLDADVLGKTPGYGNDAGNDDAGDDGGRIPTPPANPATSDDALDATRRLK